MIVLQLPVILSLQTDEVEMHLENCSALLVRQEEINKLPYRAVGCPWLSKTSMEASCLE